MTPSSRDPRLRADPGARASGPGDEPSGVREGARGRPEAPPTADIGSDDEVVDEGESIDDAAGAESDLLARVVAERDEYLADLQRLAAEYENYRKRTARDQERLVAYAHERLVRELLPVLDDLERTLEAAERHEEAALVDGVRLVQRSLRNALEKEGLVEITTDGPFDPHVHEALMAKSEDGVEPGSVLEVVQRGYRLGDKVVRPARVIVAG